MRVKPETIFKLYGLDFPSFSEGLSLREGLAGAVHGTQELNFPSFSEGLSLRDYICKVKRGGKPHFPSFSEGLSLREFKA